MRYQWLVPRCPAVNVRPDAVILFIANALRTTRAGGDEKNGQHSEQRRDGPRFTWRASGSNPVSCGRHEPISTSFPALVPFASPPLGSSPFCVPPLDQVPFAAPPLIKSLLRPPRQRLSWAAKRPKILGVNILLASP